MSKPSQFRRSRILIIGCGDIGIRVAQQLQGHTLAQSQGRPKIFALSSSPERFAELRKHGITPIEGNLDHPETLWRIAHLATTVIHLAPPAQDGEFDQRTRNLIQILSQQGDLSDAWSTSAQPECTVIVMVILSTRPVNCSPPVRGRSDAWMQSKHSDIGLPHKVLH